MFKFHFIKKLQEEKIQRGDVLEAFYLFIQQTGQTLAIWCVAWGCFLRRLHLTLQPLSFSIDDNRVCGNIGSSERFDE